MAYIQFRNGSYRASVVRKGVRRTATFDTKREAELWSLSLENAILEKRIGKSTFNNIPDSVLSVVDLFERYSREVSIKKRGYKVELYRLKALIKNPFFDIPVIEFTTKKMIEWRTIRLSQVSPSTLNRELNLISSVINYAIKELWIDETNNNPVHSLRRPENSKPRQRLVSDEEKEKLSLYLGWDKETEPSNSKQWVAFAFFLALETAMRRGEILSIQWKDVYLEESFIHLELTKNGDDRDVPLSLEAKRLLELITSRKKNNKVIPLTPDRVTKIFINACRKCNIENLHFHDTRREAITNLSEKLTLIELAAVSGHKSINLLNEVYYKAKVQNLAKKINNK